MKHYLGIDLSKEYFDVTLLKATGEQIHAQFENRPTGHGKLWKWLKEHGTRQAAVCMEATNTYWEAVTEYLHNKGYQVSVVNPARIKGYAMSQLRRSKTDKLASAVIADFCRSCTAQRRYAAGRRPRPNNVNSATWCGNALPWSRP